MSKTSSGGETPPNDRRVSQPGANAKPRPAANTGGPVRKPKSPSLLVLGRDAPPPAQQRAAMILEVLAGEQTAAEAARLPGISVMHYYLLERKAIEGLVAACAPRPKGPPGPSPEQELARLRRELHHSRRECLRQAALVRATQRAIGFPAAKASSSKDPAGRSTSSPMRPRTRPRTRRHRRRGNALGVVGRPSGRYGRRGACDKTRLGRKRVVRHDVGRASRHSKSRSKSRLVRGNRPGCSGRRAQSPAAIARRCLAGPDGGDRA